MRLLPDQTMFKGADSRTTRVNEHRISIFSYVPTTLPARRSRTSHFRGIVLIGAIAASLSFWANRVMAINAKIWLSKLQASFLRSQFCTAGMTPLRGKMTRFTTIYTGMHPFSSIITSLNSRYGHTQFLHRVILSKALINVNSENY